MQDQIFQAVLVVSALIVWVGVMKVVKSTEEKRTSKVTIARIK